MRNTTLLTPQRIAPSSRGANQTAASRRGGLLLASPPQRGRGAKKQPGTPGQGQHHDPVRPVVSGVQPPLFVLLDQGLREELGLAVPPVKVPEAASRLTVLLLLGD